MKLLFVEDDANLSKALSYILSENDYQVDTALDGKTGFELGKSNNYDVIVLDGMLPEMDGNEVCSQLRREGVDTPIIMLTARDSVHSKIEGLDSGADDYMTKPFAPAELLAHLRALTRRKGKVVFETVDYIDLSLNLNSHDISCKDQTIHLSHKEYKIIEMLMLQAGQTISKNQLIEEIWGKDSKAEDNNVEAYISFLRKKLDFLKSETKIETLRKTGYRLVKK